MPKWVNPSRLLLIYENNQLAAFFLEFQTQNSSQQPKMTSDLTDTIKTWKIECLNQSSLRVKFSRLQSFLSCSISIERVNLSFNQVLKQIFFEKENTPNKSAYRPWRKILPFGRKRILKIVLCISTFLHLLSYMWFYPVSLAQRTHRFLGFPHENAQEKRREPFTREANMSLDCRVLLGVLPAGWGRGSFHCSKH